MRTQAEGKFPAGMWNQVMKSLKKVEDASGKKFGNPEQSFAGFMSFRRKILHAGHDGYRTKHRFER